MKRGNSWLYVMAMMVLVGFAACTKCIVCNTQGTDCFECVGTNYQAYYCDVDSLTAADLRVSPCTVSLSPIAANKELEECGDSNEELAIYRADYTSKGLTCRDK